MLRERIRTSAKVFVVARSKDETEREEHTDTHTDNTYYCIKPIIL